MGFLLRKSLRRDLNSRPIDYESITPTTELLRRNYLIIKTFISFLNEELLCGCVGVVKRAGLKIL